MKKLDFSFESAKKSRIVDLEYSRRINKEHRDWDRLVKEGKAIVVKEKITNGYRLHYELCH